MVMEVDLDSLAPYFDNAATTPVDPRVVQEMLPYFSEAFGNANSIHEPGQRAHAAVELARERVAELIGAEDPAQVLFTSGSTEANNWVLRESASSGGWVSPFEHSSVREPARTLGYRELEAEGIELKSPEPGDGLLSMMSVNNETGACWDPRKLFLSGSIAIHSDITQQVGKLDTDVTGLSYASLSAHKFYGPKGVGALFAAVPSLDPLLYGGEHENGLRAGTLNVPGIVGMGAAAAIAAEEADENRRHVETLRALVLAEVEKINDVQLNSPDGASPYIVSLSFLGVEGETLVVELDRAGFSISSGAACSSRSTDPSHVLTALGLAPEWIRGTVRISFGKYNTEAASSKMAKELRDAVEKLRTMV
jgi:cysteine desulfurase